MSINKNISKVILSSFSDAPGLEVTFLKNENPSKSTFWQMTIKTTDNICYRFSIIWAGWGWPKDIIRTIKNISGPWPRHLVVAAQSLSKGALEELSRRDANWVDGEGNIRLIMPPGLVILKVGTKEKAKQKPDFCWSSSSIILAEFLLATLESKIDLKTLAEKTGWSIPQTSNILSAFDEKEWTTRHGPPRGRGVWREFTNPGALLESWCAYLLTKRPQRKLAHRLMRDPVRFFSLEFAPAIKRRSEIWAATGWIGLELSAPYSNIVPSIQIYLPSQQYYSDVTSILNEVQAKEVAEGGNIEFYEMDFPLLTWSKNENEFPVINLPRLYVDLMALGGRAKDGAEHLREIRLGY